MYQRILVATDGSPWSDAAVAYALALATSMGAEVRILTVLVVHATYAMPDMMASSELVMESVERQGQGLLARAADQAARAGVMHATLCKWGNVSQTILQTATEAACDLIVLGSRMVAGRKRLWLGNISSVVAAKATQPVLVVKRPPGPTSTGPCWRRVLVATGGSPWSDAAVEHALLLAQVQRFEVCLLHVVSKSRRHIGSRDAAVAEDKGILSLAEARAAAASVSYEACLAYGDVTTAILETATHRQCDVIILGSRGLTGWKRLMLGSISNAVAVKTALPVLIVKRFLLP